MAELTAKELFRAKNGDGVQNVRDCEGQILRPIAFTTKRYIGQDEKEHEVLIIKDGKSGPSLRSTGTMKSLLAPRMMRKSRKSLSSSTSPRRVIPT